MCLEFLGIFCGVIGFISAIITCVLPRWIVAVDKVVWAGLWMTCITQSTGQMQCEIYNSTLTLPQEVQAAKYMTLISFILGILGVPISIVGAKCTNCIEDKAAKAKLRMISGIVFILASILVLVAVWLVTPDIIQEFKFSLPFSDQRMEKGASIYIGWASAALFLIGGVLMCSHCPPNKIFVLCACSTDPQQVVFTKTDGGHNNRNNV